MSCLLSGVADYIVEHVLLITLLNTFKYLIDAQGFDVATGKCSVHPRISSHFLFCFLFTQGAILAATTGTSTWSKWGPKYS